jgi:hypothetical protein
VLSFVFFVTFVCFVLKVSVGDCAHVHQAPIVLHFSVPFVLRGSKYMNFLRKIHLERHAG